MESGKKRILVVNDEQAMLAQIKRWLAITGYLVNCTRTGEHGIKLFTKKQFDLVVLDYHLKKERTGEQTARTFIPLFKSINPSVPIVIVSATETNLNKDELGVSAVFIVESAIWKTLPQIISQVLDN